MQGSNLNGKSHRKGQVKVVQGDQTQRKKSCKKWLSRLDARLKLEWC